MRLVLILILTMLLCQNTPAISLDMSVDKEIKEKYNSSKLSDEMLPALPAHLKNQQNTPQTSPKNVTKTTPTLQTTISKAPTALGIKIPSGTKFHVKSTTKLSDWSAKNTQATFVSTESVYKGLATIPSGTVFKGNIIISHRPQITGNGGLLELNITSMKYNGKNIPIEGKITKVNTQNIFFNKIKGKRQYITGVKNKINSASKFYKKARNISNKLSSNPVGSILSPIPTLTGWLGAFGATTVSPITGLLQKGKNVSLPAGSEFEIKLTKDAYLN